MAERLAGKDTRRLFELAGETGVVGGRVRQLCGCSWFVIVCVAIEKRLAEAGKDSLRRKFIKTLRREVSLKFDPEVDSLRFEW